MNEQVRTYIGVKMVKARPEKRDGEAGYAIQYPDGYKSWSPEGVFDRAYLPLKDSTKISAEDLEEFIGPYAVEEARIDNKTTLIKLTPRTGFVQYETSSCVDPANYDHDLGVELAVNKIRNRLWPMLGFVLQWAVKGLK